MDHVKSLVRLLLFILILPVSCKKEVSSPIPTISAATSFTDIFDSFWNQMSTNYVFWDIDKTDWNLIYRQYRPKFQSLRLNNQQDIQLSEQYFRDITKDLIDGHFQIQFNNALLLNRTISPTLDRKFVGKDFHSAYPYSTVDRTYLSSGYLSGDYVTADNQRLSVTCGMIGESVLFMGFNRFALQQAYQSKTPNDVKKVLDYFFSKVSVDGGSLKKVIIDLRNNSGGDISDLNFLYGKLVSRSFQFGFSRYKTGNDRLSYTPWIETKINSITPSGNAFQLLTIVDNYSMSLAEISAMLTATDPRGTVLGETTYGATGALASNGLYNAGTFQVFDFMEITCSAVAFKFIDGVSYEGIGFSPDINIPYDLPALNAGHDKVLEKAINF